MSSFATVLKCCAAFILLQLDRAAADSPCTQVSSCKCTSSEGDIDLSTLDNPSQPLQYTIGNLWTYKYNPCTGFTCGTYPKVAVCKNYLSLNYDAGDQSTATFGFDETQKMNYIKYTTNTVTGSRVFLQCDENETGKIVSGDDSSSEIQLTLASSACCPVRSGGGGGSPGLSVGSILLIIFFCLLFAYIAGGIAFMHFVRHESGINLIPNLEFWMGLPALIRDGCIFTYNTIAALITGRSRDGYSPA